MAAQVSATGVRREGGTLIVTTQDPAGEVREHRFSVVPPLTPTDEQFQHWRGEGRPVELGPEGAAAQHTPEGWIRQCVREALALHAHDLQGPELEDLAHLVSDPIREP